MVESVAGAWQAGALVAWPVLLGLAALILVRCDARTSMSAAAAWLTGLVVQLARPLAAAADWPSAAMTVEADAALRLIAAALTTFGLVLYARRLRREANGWLIVRPASKEKRASQAQPASADSKAPKSAKRKASDAPRKAGAGKSQPSPAQPSPTASPEPVPTLSLEEAKRKRRKKRKRRAA